MIDTAIIGGGPAGLTAGISLSRMGWRTCVFDSKRPRNAATIAVHGVIAREGISPHALRSEGSKTLVDFGGEVISSEVTSVRCIAHADNAHSQNSAQDSGLGITDTLQMTQCMQTTQCVYEIEANVERHTQQFHAKTVLIASGVTEIFPQIKNLRAAYGTSIHSCLACDMWEKRDSAIGLIGFGPDRLDLFQRAACLSLRSPGVTVFYDQFNEGQKNALNSLGVKVVESHLTEALFEQGLLTGFIDADCNVHSLPYAFVRPVWKANLDFLLGGEVNCVAEDTDFLVTDNRGRLSQLGMWAAGDVTGPGQVSIASGQGAAAALDISRYLFELDGKGIVNRVALRLT